jgi:hypothetical protein
MRETWYMLESGEVADPRHVVSDAKGKLFCNGVAVAMKGDVPHTTGVDVDAVKAPTVNREVTAEVPKRTYKTRGSK